jgi:hypothetical protein
MLYFKLLLKKLSKKEVETRSLKVYKTLNDIREQVVTEITDLYSFFIPHYLFPKDFLSNVKRQVLDALGETCRMRDLITVAERIIYNDTVELMIKLNHGVMPELAQV